MRALINLVKTDFYVITIGMLLGQSDYQLYQYLGIFVFIVGQLLYDEKGYII